MVSLKKKKKKYKINVIYKFHDEFIPPQSEFDCMKTRIFLIKINNTKLLKNFIKQKL